MEMSAEAVLQEFRQKIQDAMMHPDHPRFFAFIPSPSNFVSAMADTLACGLNVFAGTWLEASGPAEIELLRLIGFVMHAAFQMKLVGCLLVEDLLQILQHSLQQDTFICWGIWITAVMYCSDQTHSSIERGLVCLVFNEINFGKFVRRSFSPGRCSIGIRSFVGSE